MSTECAGEGTPEDVVESLKNNGVLADAISEAVREMLPDLVAAERSQHDAATHERLIRMLTEGRTVAPGLLQTGAAQVLELALAQPEDAYPRWSWILADHVRTELVWREILGSRWASSSGCGVQIEGEEPQHVGCGMGNVPRLSRRFLHFFTER